jgi:hypothetical protein
MVVVAIMATIIIHNIIIAAIIHNIIIAIMAITIIDPFVNTTNLIKLP